MSAAALKKDNNSFFKLVIPPKKIHFFPQNLGSTSMQLFSLRSSHVQENPVFSRSRFLTVVACLQQWCFGVKLLLLLLFLFLLYTFNKLFFWKKRERERAITKEREREREKRKNLNVRIVYIHTHTVSWFVGAYCSWLAGWMVGVL